MLLFLPATASDDTLASRAQQALKRHCVRCHSGQDTDDSGFNVMNVAGLREADDGYLTAGDPEDSLIYTRIVDEEMPPSEIRKRAPVTEQEREAIRKWIESGAPDFPSAAARKHVTLEAIYATALRHLRRSDASTRPYLRFFTLHNLFNRKSVELADLHYYQAALSKALNSLSWERRIKLPQRLDVWSDEASAGPDAGPTILFAIDVRDYGWDRNSGWRELQRLYPYGISAEFDDERLHEYDLAIQNRTETELPVLRADWFVANATRPPLYHKLLDIPDSAVELEARLEVSIAKDFVDPKTERIARAGFARSGVSGQNRLVQRSDALHGFYWKSYDFKPDTGRAKLTRFPLGPANLFPGKRHPYDRFAFEHDGGEVIFSLPNGLQAYMLVDGNDDRIDSGPVEVVYDALATSGTPLIVNGLSCMACHKHGMIEFTDTVRDGNATFGSVEKQVRQLYPPNEAMRKLLSQDRDQFLRALDQCVSPFLRTERSGRASIESLDEPVSKVAIWHRSVYLDLETVLSELDLETSEQLFRLGDKPLKMLGLETLRNGGVISRPEWEAFDRQFGPSLMQQTASALGLTPVRPL
ncbi:Planctomycete cytochrome C [Stieleria maiorica]|uniref:Planctomycete cytochrome C n=2 Tax=Stieleria maiorica TaxID=2795974 RepID=A0A5B9MJA4_9BACT|nr:Planctomycete cytochrome C [Stieleria maiorica]